MTRAARRARQESLTRYSQGDKNSARGAPVGAPRAEGVRTAREPLASIQGPQGAPAGGAQEVAGAPGFLLG